MDTNINPQVNVPTGAPPAGDSDRNMKLIISLIVIVVVLVAGYLLFRSGLGTKKEAGMTGRSEVIQTDLIASVSKVPAGFPAFVPVEEENVKESYKINYFDEGVTQYTVSFTSALTFDELWKAYSDLFVAIGFTPDTEKTSEDKGVMTGYRSGNKLNIAISDYDSGQYITINFIERQLNQEEL